MEAPPADTGRRPEHPPLQLLLLFLLAAAVAVGLCASAVLRRRCGDRKDHAAKRAGCGSVKEALMGTLRWSSSRKLGQWELPTRAGGAWESLVDAATDPSSPLWQRRILMGERCELPRFSGLILYDERGFPLHANAAGAGHSPHQQDQAAMVVTTLRDLL